jgi:hypothetical protein
MESYTLARQVWISVHEVSPDDAIQGGQEEGSRNRVHMLLVPS